MEADLDADSGCDRGLSTEVLRSIQDEALPDDVYLVPQESCEDQAVQAVYAQRVE